MSKEETLKLQGKGLPRCLLVGTVMSLLAGCASFGLPPGSQVRSTVNLPTEGAVRVAADDRRGLIYLVFPDGSYVEAAGLRGMANATAVSAKSVPGRDMILFRGAVPSCSNRYALAIVHRPIVGSIQVPDCGKDFALIAQRDGRTVAIYQSGPRSRPTYYTITAERLFGPPDQDLDMRVARRPQIPRRTPQAARGPGSTPAATTPPTVPAGVNLDLPATAPSTGVNLD